MPKTGNLRFPGLGIILAATNFAAVAFDTRLEYCTDPIVHKRGDGHRIGLAVYTPRTVWLSASCEASFACRVVPRKMSIPVQYCRCGGSWLTRTRRRTVARAR